MKFWDSSVIVPLLVTESSTPRYLKLLKADKGGMLVWWGSPIECVSAISRRVREGKLSDSDASKAIMRLEQLRSSWVEIEPSELVRRTAIRLLRVHDLRSDDAMQLAAARVVTRDENASEMVFLTEDERLKQAAARDGFQIVQ